MRNMSKTKTKTKKLKAQPIDSQRVFLRYIQNVISLMGGTWEWNIIYSPKEVHVA